MTILMTPKKEELGPKMNDSPISNAVICKKVNHIQSRLNSITSIRKRKAKRKRKSKILPIIWSFTELM